MMPELAALLAVVFLLLGAFAAGAVWARRRARVRLGMEIESRQRAEREAIAAHRVKSEILANVSHEIRTPMNGVIGMTDLLLTTELPAARRRQALEVIHTSGEMTLALVDDLLDFSRIEVGKLSFRGADFRLRDLLREVIDLLRPQAKDKGLELRLEIDRELADPFHSDPARLRQVLLNLIGNAIKFTHEGEVTVHVEPAASGKARAEERTERTLVHFAVRDTGIGISPSDQARIFAPFTQAESSAARDIGGAGLGLMISKNLVELLGGEIGFESIREVGSTFWLRVPLAPARESAVATEKTGPPHRPLEPVAVDAPHILVVDDTAISRRVAESQAEALGYRTASATSGASALEALETRRFDAVLMDCQMPRLDGYETTRRLRRREQDTGRRTVVIGVTAHALKGQREKIRAAGMDDFLAKPYRIAQLAAALDQCLPDSSECRSPVALHGLKSEGDDKLSAKIYRDYQREGTRDVQKIRQALTAGDARALEQSAHSLGGSASFLQADALDELCREVEDLARQGDLTGCEARLKALEKEHHRLVNALKDLLPRQP